MPGMRVAIGTVAGLVALVTCGGKAPVADVLKIAVGQCGNWDSSPVQLGMGAGIYARHGLTIEPFCTQGTGETQQAVIAGSADIGIGIGTLGALGAFAKGAPIRIITGSATGNADFWFVKGELAAEDDRGRHRHATPSPTRPTAHQRTASCWASSASSA